MACALTQGYNLDCRDSVGGIKAIYIMELDNVTTATATAGVISAIVKASAKRYWKYTPAKQTGAATETITGSEENGTIFYGQEVTFPLNKLQASVRNEIILLAQNRCSVIAEDMNGKKWMFGHEHGMHLNAGSAATGTAMGDRNGYTLTFTGAEKALAYEVTATDLETPGT